MGYGAGDVSSESACLSDSMSKNALLPMCVSEHVFYFPLLGSKESISLLDIFIFFSRGLKQVEVQD